MRRLPGLDHSATTQQNKASSALVAGCVQQQVLHMHGLMSALEIDGEVAKVACFLCHAPSIASERHDD